GKFQDFFLLFSFATHEKWNRQGKPGPLTALNFISCFTQFALEIECFQGTSRTWRAKPAWGTVFLPDHDYLPLFYSGFLTEFTWFCWVFWQESKAGLEVLIFAQIFSFQWVNGCKFD